MRKKIFIISFLFIGLHFIHQTSLSHSMWITIKNYKLKVGDEAQYFIGYGHKYLSSEHWVMNLEENYWNIFKKATLIDPDGEKSILKPTKGSGKFIVKKEGVYILGVKSERKVGEPYGPSGKYAKAVIQVGKKDKGFSHVFGHRIEIIPLENPAKIKPGGFLTVKILFEGKPLSTFVYGTYADFKPGKDAFPSMAKSNQEGIAKIKISHKGEWLIYVNHRVDYSAVLTFEIN